AGAQVAPDQLDSECGFRLADLVELVAIEHVLVEDRDGAEQFAVGGLVGADDLVWGLLLDLFADLARQLELETTAECVVLEDRDANGVNLHVVVGLRGVAKEGEVAVLRAGRQEKAQERQGGGGGPPDSGSCRRIGTAGDHLASPPCRAKAMHPASGGLV